MRVLIVTGIYPPDIGGPATYVPRIADALEDAGHHAEVVTLADAPRAAAADPWTVHRVPRGRMLPLRVLSTVTSIAVRARRADVVFVNGLALEATLAALLVRRPVVMKVVGDLAWERSINLGWTDAPFEYFQTARLGRRVERMKRLRSWWTRRADAVVVPSRFLARIVVGWGVADDRVRVIANAAPDVGPREGGRRPDVAAPVVAVTVGRLVAWKRVAAILDALESVPELGLVVVGDGDERSSLEARVRRGGLSDRVVFVGDRGRSATLDLMAACDFLVLASSYEGLPHVVLEAAALGLPTVATAAGGTPEAIVDGDTGVLVPVGDGPGLVRGLHRMASDAGWRQALGESARERALRFSWQRTAEETLALLTGVAACPDGDLAESGWSGERRGG